jgi:hypothetical protein
VIKDPSFPPAFDQWASALKRVRPVESAAELAPRPLLVIHGDSDDLTPPADGRMLVEAHGSAEFRLINGAGHELRHDPRAVAVFLGWLSRQQIEDAVAIGDAEAASRDPSLAQVDSLRSTGHLDSPAGDSATDHNATGDNPVDHSATDRSATDGGVDDATPAEDLGTGVPDQEVASVADVAEIRSDPRRSPEGEPSQGFGANGDGRR